MAVGDLAFYYTLYLCMKHRRGANNEKIILIRTAAVQIAFSAHISTNVLKNKQNADDDSPPWLCNSTRPQHNY